MPSAPDSGNDIGTEQTSGDQGHTRQTHQSRNNYSNPSTVMPAPVHLQNQEGRPPLPSAPDSGTDKMDIKSTFASNPKGLSLSQFDKLFKRNGMKLVTVPGNGFCFISCVLVTLAEQGINKSLDVLSVEIMIEQGINILTPTPAILELTNADTVTRNLSYVQNAVKDSNGCSRENAI